MDDDASREYELRNSNYVLKKLQFRIPEEKHDFNGVCEGNSRPSKHTAVGAPKQEDSYEVVEEWCIPGNLDHTYHQADGDSIIDGMYECIPDENADDTYDCVNDEKDKKYDVFNRKAAGRMESTEGIYSAIDADSNDKVNKTDKDYTETDNLYEYARSNANDGIEDPYDNSNKTVKADTDISDIYDHSRANGNERDEDWYGNFNKTVKEDTEIDNIYDHSRENAKGGDEDQYDTFNKTTKEDTELDHVYDHSRPTINGVDEDPYNSFNKVGRSATEADDLYDHARWTGTTQDEDLYDESSALCRPTWPKSHH